MNMQPNGKSRMKPKPIPPPRGFFWSVIILLCGIRSAFGAGLEVLPGHVPEIARNLVRKGQLSPTNELSLAIGLPSRDEQGLDRFIRELYDPASANYHRYLTPAQFTENFGPTENDYKTLIDFANASG